jgi:hypothetical protein
MEPPFHPEEQIDQLLLGPSAGGAQRADGLEELASATGRSRAPADHADAPEPLQVDRLVLGVELLLFLRQSCRCRRTSRASGVSISSSARDLASSSLSQR